MSKENKINAGKLFILTEWKTETTKQTLLTVCNSYECCPYLKILFPPLNKCDTNVTPNVTIKIINSVHKNHAIQ